MADRTTTESNGADEKTAAAAASASGGGMKSFLPIIVTLVLMPALAWAMTTFVLIPKVQKAIGGAPTESAEAGEAKAADEKHAAKDSKEKGKEKGGAKQSVNMTKLLVNVAGTMGSRYLLTSLTLSGAGADFRLKIEKHDAQLRDMACAALATKTITDLEKPGARNLVRSELLTGFNNILGPNVVQEIYITEFAIQ